MNWLAQSDVPYDTAKDEPLREDIGILEQQVRLRAHDGVIDSGASWGHSGPWVEDVEVMETRPHRRRLQRTVRLYRNEGTNAKPSYEGR